MAHGSLHHLQDVYGQYSNLSKALLQAVLRIWHTQELAAVAKGLALPASASALAALLPKHSGGKAAKQSS